MRKVETFLPLLFLPFHGLMYIEFSKITASRGVDFGPAVTTPLDASVPFLPLMVIPYMIAWVYPAIFLVLLLTKQDFEIAIVRRILLAVLILEAFCYVLWFAFPIKVSLRVTEAALAEHGWLGSLVSLNYKYSPVWHACPSFHVAGPWFFYRAAQLYRLPLQRTMLVLFVAIAASTVTIRIHYLIDIAGGLLVSELVYRLVLRRLQEGGAFAQSASRPAMIAYVSAPLFLLGALVLMRAS